MPLDPRDPPLTLEIETLAPGPKETRLLVLANGVRLWNRQLPREAYRKRFGLRNVPLADELRLELRTETFYPAAVNPASRDRRKLGIVVKAIRLEREGVLQPARLVGERPADRPRLAEDVDGAVLAEVEGPEARLEPGVGQEGRQVLELLRDKGSPLRGSQHHTNQVPLRCRTPEV